MRPRWLDRRIARPGPCLCLVLSEAEFRAAAAPMKLPEIPRWLSPSADASTTTLSTPDGKHACIVSLGDTDGHNAVEIAGLLVHEAVHVWQHYCAMIGETNPGFEQEAYGIQAIAQELLAEYARRIETGCLPPKSAPN